MGLFGLKDSVCGERDLWDTLGLSAFATGPGARNLRWTPCASRGSPSSSRSTCAPRAGLSQCGRCGRRIAQRKLQVPNSRFSSLFGSVRPSFGDDTMLWTASRSGLEHVAHELNRIRQCCRLPKAGLLSSMRGSIGLFFHVCFRSGPGYVHTCCISKLYIVFACRTKPPGTTSYYDSPLMASCRALVDHLLRRILGASHAARRRPFLRSSTLSSGAPCGSTADPGQREPPVQACVLPRAVQQELGSVPCRAGGA